MAAIDYRGVDAISRLGYLCFGKKFFFWATEHLGLYIEVLARLHLSQSQ